jgi:hypothetical protein
VKNWCRVLGVFVKQSLASSARLLTRHALPLQFPA